MTCHKKTTKTTQQNQANSRQLIVLASFLFYIFTFDFVMTLLGTINEPPLPRRKKCPELAYRTHEFLTCESKNDLNASTFSNRARVSEARLFCIKNEWSVRSSENVSNDRLDFFNVAV